MEATTFDGQWNLGDLFSGPDDPAIEKSRSTAREQAASFSKTYKGRVATLDAAALAEAFASYETVMAAVDAATHYARLRFSVATDDSDVRAANSAAEALNAELNQVLAFFTVELTDMAEEDLNALAMSPELESYRHYIGYQLSFKPHTLSVDSEETIALKDATGKTAWVNLYSQITGSLSFEVEVDGEKKSLTRAELMPLAVSSDRTLREKASRASAATFEPHSDVLTYVFNTLFEDHRLETSKRGYDDVLDYTILRDDLPADVVHALLETTTANFDISHRYQAFRKRVLGLEDYQSMDLHAPLFGDEPTFSWDEAQATVQTAFDRFDPGVGEVARRFFDGRWIDVFPRKGKRSGAFCSPGTPDAHPWVMVNFAGQQKNVFTLAHELGHGLHFELARAQSPLNYWSGLPLAETASVFAELWLHDLLMERATSDEERIQLLNRQVYSCFTTAFHQVAYVNWELRAHRARAQGVVSVEEMSSMWGEEVARCWGPSVALQERDKGRWMTIPHFVFARFYCYSYAFGKLLTLSLHRLWKEQGDAFVGDYLALLTAGGSQTPVELFDAMGLDLADPTFWQGGLDVVRGYMDELEQLA